MHQLNGYVFTTRELGTGYYRDQPLLIQPLALDNILTSDPALVR